MSSAPNPPIGLIQNKQDENCFIEIPDRQRYFMIAVVLGYAMVVMAFGMIEPGNLVDRLILLGSSLLLILATGAPLLIKFKHTGFLHPLVLTSGLALVGMAIGKTDLLATGLDYHVAFPGMSRSNLTRMVAYVNVIGALAVVSQYAGYFLIGKVSLPLITFRKRPNSFFMPLLILWFALALVSIAGIVHSSGGLNYHLTNMNRGGTAKVIENETALLGLFAFVVQSAVVIPIIYALFRKNGHRSPVFFILAICILVIVYLSAGRRGSILMPLYMMIGVWIYKERQLPLIRIMLLGFALFMFVAIGGIWRENNRRFDDGVNWDFLRGYTVNDIAERSMRELSDRSGRAAAIYPIVRRVPRDVPFNYGRSYAENLYRFVPRAIWKDKPQGIGITCSEVFYGRYDLGGIPPGSLGEAYWSGHIVGVIIVFSVFGMILRIFGNTYARNWLSGGLALIFLVTIMRLDPNQISFRFWIFTMVPTMAFMFLTGLASLKSRQEMF